MASRGVVRASKFRRVATPGAARALRFNNKPTRISGSGMEFSAGTNVVPSHWNANCQSVLERDDAERSVNLTGRWGALPRRRMPKQEKPKVFHEPSANTLDACVCACVMRPLHSWPVHSTGRNGIKIVSTGKIFKFLFRFDRISTRQPLRMMWVIWLSC